MNTITEEICKYISEKIKEAYVKGVADGKETAMTTIQFVMSEKCPINECDLTKLRDYVLHGIGKTHNTYYDFEKEFDAIDERLFGNGVKS